MGKRLRQQRRGKGTPKYRAPSHRYIGKIKYPREFTEGTVVDIIHGPGKKTPVAVVNFDNTKAFMIATEGMAIGQPVTSPRNMPGSITEVENIPEGTKIYNVEIHPGDGGKLCRSSGSFATVITHDRKKTVILLPERTTYRIVIKVTGDNFGKYS